MNVLLIQSYLGENELPVYPLGLACLKSMLDKVSVRVFDPNLPMPGGCSPYTPLADMINQFHPDVIGISLRNIDSTNKRLVIFYFEEFVRLISFVRNRTEAVIVAGGAGFSLFAESIMKSCPEIDFGVYLEGETTFAALLHNMNTPESVPSIYYRKKEKIVFTGVDKKVDFQFHVNPDMDAVLLSRFSLYPESVGVETKRGCPFGCIYCPYGFLNGRSYRLKDPVRIVDGLELMVATAGLQTFSFTDSIFNVPRSHAEAVLREMIRRGLKLSWSAWYNERELDESFVRLSIAAGCRSFIFSPDGYSDRVLKKLGKQLSRNDIEKGLRLMIDSRGCEVSYNFFKNPPGQTLVDFVSMVLFCFKARWHMGRRVHFEFNSLRIEPHTRLYDLAVAEGIIQAHEDILTPVYYSQKKTAYIETLINVILRSIGK
jgi:anaerobic magnesium-protoporphyrin IX monomethyl ester cyclase